jgi:hypothetical protein
VPDLLDKKREKNKPCYYIKVFVFAQVILPFLEQVFEDNARNRSHEVTMLDILSRLLHEQPTAMALIRDNWKCYFFLFQF